MIEERPFQAKITINFQQREGGGVRALCDDIRGFYLSSDDEEGLLDDIVPALEQLLKSNYDMDVEVVQLTPAKYLLNEKQSVPPVHEPEVLEFTYHPRAA